MSQHLLSAPNAEFTDLRRNADDPDSSSHKVGPAIFTANDAGTTTTLVGANGVAGTGVNIVRVGERGVIHNSDDSVHDDTVVEITNVVVGATTTVTFTPAVATATASGDYLAPVAVVAYVDNESLDSRLNDLDSSLYTQAYLDGMTQNDKVYAIRLADDPNSL